MIKKTLITYKPIFYKQTYWFKVKYKPIKYSEYITHNKFKKQYYI